jgi:hypothetical protein
MLVWALFFASSPKPIKGLENLVPILILLLVNALFLSLRLKTQINKTGIRFSYFPFLKEKSFALEQIQSIEVVEYDPLTSYGGWGIRSNFESWAYNTSGNFGIMVTTPSKKFLLGTQKPEEAREVIAHFLLLKSENHGG